jgi:acyl-CoA thioesterase I
MALPLSPTSRWVFIGDSITDCGRSSCPEGLGAGYVRLIRDSLYASQSASAPVVINRGISGNRIGDLEGRWEEDVIALKPDLVSVKIGINDVWHQFSGVENGGTTIEKFRESFIDILERLRLACPECALVLCEPSVIWPPAPAEGNARLQPYIEAVHEMREKFDAGWVVPLHAAFENGRTLRPDIDWATDGVHPTSAGHMLIARTWLGTLGLL